MTASSKSSKPRTHESGPTEHEENGLTHHIARLSSYASMLGTDTGNEHVKAQALALITDMPRATRQSLWEEDLADPATQALFFASSASNAQASSATTRSLKSNLIPAV